MVTQFYLAPMEGVTGQVYRKVYASIYDNIDKYFTPFIAPNQNRSMSSREQKEVAWENNQGRKTVVQILTNKAPHFVKASKELDELGYHEVNLNLGCPSPTVVTKRKGAGFLEDPRVLKTFLDEIWESSACKISIKTRIGLEFEEEWEDILEVYNQYPIEELIIHPRLRQDFYNGKPRYHAFARALELCEMPLCYNGDIFSVEDYEQIMEMFPNLDRIMIGRGIIANPALVAEIKGQDKRNKEVMKLYHDRLLVAYQEEMSGDRDVLFKMKELWYYMSQMFEDADALLKKIKKTTKMQEYKGAVDMLFVQCRLKERGGFRLDK